MASEEFCYGPDDVFNDKNIRWLNNDFRDVCLKESYLTGGIDLIFFIVLIYVFLFPLSGELNSNIWGISFIVIVFSSMFFIVCYSTYLQAPIKIGFSYNHFYVIYRKRRKIKPYEIKSLQWKNIKKITQVVSGGKGPSYEIDPRWNYLRSPNWAGLKIYTKKNIEYQLYNTSIKLMKEIIFRSDTFKPEFFVQPFAIKKRSWN